MALPNIFTKPIAEAVINRIEQLQPNTPALWGKMNVAQMLAHCCVSYEMVYTNKHPKPSLLLHFILKTFVRNTIVNEVPFKKSSQTAKPFIIADDREFEKEKQLLIDFIRQAQQDGEQFYNGKESLSFGKLTGTEWNNMFYKHLDHHLRQFGA